MSELVVSGCDSSLSLQDSTPFAVIGSNTVVETRGQRVRGRLYPWGIVEGEKLLSYHDDTN